MPAYYPNKCERCGKRYMLTPEDHPTMCDPCFTKHCQEKIGKMLREEAEEGKPVKDKQEQIDEIMDTFDFEKVHQVMRTLGITWLDSDVHPTMTEIRKAARQLLKDVAFNVNTMFASSGGFRAEMDRNTGEISLEFVLERKEA